MEMQENNINNNQLDAFSEKVKSKLENHQLPVDAEWWNAIEKGIGAKKKRIIPAWFWIPLGSAAVLALIFTLNPFSDSKTVTAKLENHKVHQSHNVTLRPVEPKTSKIISTDLFNAVPKDNQKALQHPTIQPLTTIIPDKISSETNENIVTGNDSSSTVSNQEILYSEVPLVKLDTVSTKGLMKNLASNWPKKTGKIRVIQHKRRVKSDLLLAASFGSSSGPQSGFSNLPTAVMSNNIVSTKTDYTAIMAPDNFDHINYATPVSFGLAVRKNLDKAFSLETGLVYTYLQTIFSNNPPVLNDAQSNLHYLGVPLNIVAKVWSSPKWEVYLSGGGMVEKGIRSVYTQHQYYFNQTISTTASTNISGFQWSVDAGVGATYKLQRNIGIFFEPKISHYFDNNQLLSIRTKQPTVFGLNIGVRYELK